MTGDENVLFGWNCSSLFHDHGHRPTTWVVRLHRRESEGKSRAALGSVFDPDATLMSADDGAAYGEPHTQPFGFHSGIQIDRFKDGPIISQQFPHAADHLAGKKENAIRMQYTRRLIRDCSPAISGR